ncbi:MAG: YezD family protein [Chromatiales bacterium]
MTPHRPAPADGTDAVALTERLTQALQGIRYGSVEVVIHDGRVVHIERKEKLRLNPAPTGGHPR